MKSTGDIYGCSNRRLGLAEIPLFIYQTFDSSVSEILLLSSYPLHFPFLAPSSRKGQGFMAQIFTLVEHNCNVRSVDWSVIVIMQNTIWPCAVLILHCKDVLTLTTPWHINYTQLM